jgi:hypothetical protein
MRIVYIPPFGKGRLGGIFVMRKSFMKSPLSPLFQRGVFSGQHLINKKADIENIFYN